MIILFIIILNLIQKNKRKRVSLTAVRDVVFEDDLPMTTSEDAEDDEWKIADESDLQLFNSRLEQKSECI